MLELPGEIWLRVSDYLDYSDYHNFRITCRLFYELTIHDVWSDVEVGMIPFKRNKGIRTEKCHNRTWVPFQGHTCRKRFTFLTIDRVYKLLTTIPNYQWLLAQVTNFSCYETEIESVKSTAESLVNLNTISVSGRASKSTLNLLTSQAFKNVPRVFVSGTFDRVDELQKWPQLCHRLINLSVFFGIEEDHDMLRHVAKSLTNLESLSLVNRVNPRMIHIDDLIHFVTPLSGSLQNIRIAGPVDNHLNIDWVPPSVIEFSIDDDDYKRSEGINIGHSVKRLILQIGSSLGHEEVNFQFPNLEHLEVHSKYIEDEEFLTIPWVNDIILNAAEGLKSLYISIHSTGLGILDSSNIGKTFPSLESLVLDFNAQKAGEEFANKNLSTSSWCLPNLNFVVLHLNLSGNIETPWEFINSLIMESPNLQNFHLDEMTLKLFENLPSIAMGQLLFDEFNILHEFIPPQLHLVSKKDFYGL